MRIKTVFLACLSFLLLSFNLRNADMKILMNDVYEGEKKLMLSNKKIKTLEIVNGNGELEIVGSKLAKQISVQAYIKVRANKRKKINRILNEKMDLRLVQKGNKALLISNFNNTSDQLDWILKEADVVNGTIHLKVTVPEHMNLNIIDESGNMSLHRIGGSVSIKDGAGHIELNKISGDVLIKDGSGDIEMNYIHGTIRLDDGAGDIKAEQIDGHMVIEDGTDDIYVHQINGNMKINDGSGKIDVKSVDGSLSIEDSEGDIVVDEIKKDLTLMNRGVGACQLSNIHGSLIGI